MNLLSKIKTISLLCVIFIASFIGCVGTPSNCESECFDESIEETSEEIVLSLPLPKKCTNCLPAPYTQLYSQSGQYSTWANSDCTGDWARGVLSGGKPCAQWNSGDVYCVDLAQPVPDVYFKDPNDYGICKKWTLTSEPWFKWTFCGNQPLPKE